MLDSVSSSDDSGSDKRAGWSQTACPIYLPTPSLPLPTLDVEESFRVVEEDSDEPSLTAHILPQGTGIQGQQQRDWEEGESNSGFVSARGSVVPGRLGSELSDLSSVPSGDNELDRMTTLSYSVYSMCESRLRNLGQDGMELAQDPIQQMVANSSALYQKQIAELQVRLKQLALLQMDRENSSAVCDTQDPVPSVTNPLDRQVSSAFPCRHK